MTDYDAQPGRKPPEQPRLSTSQREADELDLHAGLLGLAGMVAGARGVFELLGEVAEFAAQVIPGVDAAGVGLIDADQGRPTLQKAAATAEFVHEIDIVQYDELHEGPCITCMQSRRAVVSGSLGSDSRWPRFGGRVARMDVHSALSLPLMVGEHVIGAINSYATSHDAFGEHAVQLGSQFAGPAAVSVYNAQLLAEARERAEQLQQALESRAVIDQAIGIVRSRTGASAEWAFGRLVRMSQTENTKLYVIAERLVAESVRRAQARRRHP
ncbi:MAG TPA: GAF and ANTAR domain-containing protein [Mycobacterium sp.]|uniref:GAF and ANTAR domain-containing protein n=1 Tax=Mycobacterium sp. TaxID=1785 RepID=UPI002C8BC152|nr:GAF and ANTAR domain-containing protein [Mycobacterium sp.]HME77360.1 GAF and ANTAR domain-containing protein [Mycobacterium sp.]